MTLDTGFQTDQPAVGPAIFENQTDDLKVTRSLTWIFTLAEERAFQTVATQPELSQPGTELVPMNINLAAAVVPATRSFIFTQMPVQTSIDGGW